MTAASSSSGDSSTSFAPPPLLLPKHKFQLDQNDAYHLLAAELDPPVLDGVLPVDQGDLHHPAIVISDAADGLYTLSEVLAAAGEHPPLGPLYTPFEVVELAREVEVTGLPNALGLKKVVRSHLNLPALTYMLKGYEDEWVIKGSTYGWPLCRDPGIPLSGQLIPNHSSANKHTQKVEDFFATEVKLGAVYPLGHVPPLPPPLSNIPLLTVPKPPVVGAVRVCGDCSFPAGSSVNDGIRMDVFCGEPYRCKLPGIWDFLAILREIGLQDVVLAKADQSRGYRQVPICPGDWSKQMFHLPRFGFFLDTRGIFGCRPCGSFKQRENQAIAYAAVNMSVVIDQEALEKSVNVEKQAVRGTSTYIDDTLLAAHKACAVSAWQNVLGANEAANIKLSTTPGHVSPPGRSVIALGFLVDCDSGSVSLPPEKLGEMLVLAAQVLEAGSCTRKTLQMLLGRLARVIMVVREGHRFIGRLLSLIQGPQVPPSHLISLTEEAAQDLLWWLRHGPLLNARTVVTMPVLSGEAVILTDGRGKGVGNLPSVGGLCYNSKEYFSMVVPATYHEAPVHVIEAVALLAACRRWVPGLPPGCVVPVGCDNMGVVMSYQGGKARNRYLAAAARLLWGVFAMSGSVISLRYVPSSQNSSDGVSRLKADHCSFLDENGWVRVVLADDLFSLDEDSPVVFKEGMQGDCRQPPSVSALSPSQKAPTTTWRQGSRPGTTSAPSSGSSPSLRHPVTSSSSWLTVPCSKVDVLTPLATTCQAYGGFTCREESSWSLPLSSSPSRMQSRGPEDSCRDLQRRSGQLPPVCSPTCSLISGGALHGGVSSCSCLSASPGSPVSSQQGGGRSSDLRNISPGKTCHLVTEASQLS